MAGLAKVTLVGYVGGDPELRYTQNALAVTNFSLATTEKVRGEDHTEWFKVTAWGKLAEIVGQWVSKGMQLYVEGRFNTSEWIDREGRNRVSLEVNASQILMFGKKDSDDTARPSAYAAARPSAPQTQPPSVSEPQVPNMPDPGIPDAPGPGVPATPAVSPSEQPQEDDIPF